MNSEEDSYNCPSTEFDKKTIYKIQKLFEEKIYLDNTMVNP